MTDKLTVSLTVLLTGFAVVFAVLLVLIGIIKLYGTIVYNIQNRAKEKAKKNIETAEPVSVPQPAAVEAAPEEDEDEIIAVISAAVYSMYSDKPVRIRSIRKSNRRSNAWRNAGLSDSVRPF